MKSVFNLFCHIIIDTKNKGKGQTMDTCRLSSFPENHFIR